MSDTLREIESIISRAIFSESREAAFALKDSAVAAIEQIESERDEARKEVARLKAENGTLRNAQMCCESCDETVTVETLRGLRADNARLDWLEKRESMEGFTRDAIDAAMKGEL